MYNAEYSTDGGKTWIVLRSYLDREKAAEHAKAFKTSAPIGGKLKTRVMYDANGVRWNN